MTNEDTKQLVVAKSNTMVRQSRINLTLTEQRIINYMISQIQPNYDYLPDIILNYHDFCKLCNLTTSNLYHMRQVLLNLKRKVWEVFENGSYRPISWISDYSINNNDVFLSFDKRMGKYLLNLIKTGNYVQAELYYYFQFQSKYTFILYDYFKSFANISIKNKDKKYNIVISIDEFRKILGLESKYKLFADLKKNIITPCLEEITKETDIDVECSYISKKGKRISDIKFQISAKTAVEKLQIWNNPNFKRIKEGI